MPRTRIKFCGITRPEDAQAAQRLGVDALGLNFCTASPRYISARQAAEIAAYVAPLVSLVGVFVNPQAEEVEAVLSHVPLDVLQFHGDESAVFCASFQRPWIKAVRVESRDSLQEQLDQYRSARGLLLDSHVEGVQGGTGQAFDWEEVVHIELPFLLAGGLHPENVAQAIGRVGPFGVDVSSGIELSPGIKDAAKMRAFIDAVGRADRSARDGK